MTVVVVGVVDMEPRVNNHTLPTLSVWGCSSSNSRQPAASRSVVRDNVQVTCAIPARVDHMHLMPEYVPAASSVKKFSSGESLVLWGNCGLGGRGDNYCMD